MLANAQQLLNCTSTRWVCIRIETLAGAFSAGLAAYLVYWGGVSASNTGFALTMAGTYCDSLRSPPCLPLRSWLQRHDLVVGPNTQRVRSQRYVLQAVMRAPCPHVNHQETV